MSKVIPARWRAALLLIVSATGIHAAHIVKLQASIADPGAQVEDVHVGLSYSEGPAVDPLGNVYFSEDPDVETGRIWKITPEGTKTVFKEPSRGSNGLEFDLRGRLNICMFDSVLRVEADGVDGSGRSRVTVLAATGTGGLKLDRVNDLSIAGNGAMFFSNLNGNTLFYRSPEGQIRTRNYSGPNGVEWIEEKGILYIGNLQGLKKCQVNNQTGELGTCRDFAGPTDGLTTDVEGNVYRASWLEGKIFVHDSTGKELGSIAIDSREVQGKRFSRGATGNVSNCHFGGPDRKSLFITGDGGLYKVKLKMAGRVRPGTSTGLRIPADPVLAPEPRIILRRQGGGRLIVEEVSGRRAGVDGRILVLNKSVPVARAWLTSPR
jgi:gluconolactonase